MNKWQTAYCNEYYNGKMPRSKEGKRKLELLEQVKETVTVEYPEINGTPAHTETYQVTEDDCDMPNGKISVSVLLSNLTYWSFRGFKVTTQ